jgi:hypothetical protein
MMLGERDITTEKIPRSRRGNSIYSSPIGFKKKVGDVAP